MENIESFEKYLELHYSNPNTRLKYLEIAKRVNLLDFNQDTVNNFLIRYKNNIVNRAALKAMAECFNKTIIIPKQKSRSDAKEKEKFLEKEEVDFIINHTTYKTSLMVRLMFETGLRLFEIINLKQSDIDLNENRVKGIGKGQKYFNLTISNKTSNLLSDYLIKHNKEFPFHYPGIQHQEKKFWYILRKECSNKGIKGVHPHRIRHSLGHYLRANLGFDLEQVRERLRHKSVVTTQIYTTATKEEVEKKIERELFED